MKTTPLPQPFLEQRWDFLNHIIDEEIHGSWVEANFEGKFACQVLTAAQSALVLDQELKPPCQAFAMRTINCWSLERKLPAFYMPAIKKPDMVLTCEFDPSEGGWCVTGEVRNKFLASKSAARLREALILCKLREIEPNP